MQIQQRVYSGHASSAGTGNHVTEASTNLMTRGLQGFFSLRLFPCYAKTVVFARGRVCARAKIPTVQATTLGSKAGFR